jgi:uncharacterized membrane protein
MLVLGTLPAPTSPPILAGSSAGEQFLTVFIWFAAAAVLALGGFYLVVAVRRWISRDQVISTFTIQDLRELRDRGDITELEFTAMRAKLLAQLDLSGPGDASDSAPPDEAQES